jgi:hypothetical protein
MMARRRKVPMSRGRRPFRFGVIGESITSRERLLGEARRAEALGYSTLLLRDHFVPSRSASSSRRCWR